MRKKLSIAFQILMLDKNAMNDVARDNHKTATAFMILVIPLIVNLILASLTVRHFSYFHFQTLISGLFISVVAIFLASAIADKGFGGTASHMGFFRVIGYGSFVGWLNIVTYVFFMFGIPGLSGLRSTLSLLVGLWTLLIFYKALRCVHSLREGDAFTVMVATVLLVLVIQGLFLKFF